MENKEENMLEQKYLDYEKSIRKFVKDNVENVLKEPREFIHYPFIDPGSIYDGECVGLGHLLVCVWPSGNDGGV